MNSFSRCLLVAALGFSWHAHAVTFVVTRTDDPSPDGCQPGDCSLREAAIAADGNDEFAARDVISLPAGAYALTLGELPMHQNLEIAGSGSAQTSVNCGATALLNAFDDALFIHGLTLQTTNGFVLAVDGGLKLDDIRVPVGGGSISGGGNNAFSTAVEVSNSELRDSLDCTQSHGSCTISDSHLLTLTFFGEFPGPKLLMQRSTIDGTLDPDYSSGLLMRVADGITIEDSVITDTTYGMTFSNPFNAAPGEVVLTRLRYVRNGGPINFEEPATVTVVDSEFRDNSRINPTQVGAFPAAAWAREGSDWTISGTTFSGNIGNSDAGGALLIEGGAHVLVDNSTFSGNSFTVAAAAAHARGAAIGYRDDANTTNITLRHVTIVAPTFLPAGIDGTTIGGAGGESNLVLNVINSVLRGTCGLSAGAMDTAIGNVESPGDTCDFSSASNLVSASSGDLALGTLGDHGGLTPTYEPGAASVALGAAPAALCLPLDQRGFQRAYPDLDADCDAGAVERDADERIFADRFES